MTHRVSGQARLIRRLSLLLALVAALALLWMRRSTFGAYGYGATGSLDLLQYWGAARLLLGDKNPYDPVSMLAIQQAVGWPEPYPILMWNPPWTLAVVLPLGLLPFGRATQVWLLLRIGLILGSGLFLWRYFAPRDDRFWIGALLAVAFVPGLFALRMGQISPWLLMGLGIFLAAERKRRDLLSGIGLALLMIKPHFTYLLWLAALWWAWRTWRWRVLVGWLAALIGASAVVLLIAPDVFLNYVRAASHPPLYWATPTLGAWLRRFLGENAYGLQFLPSFVGAFGLLIWLWQKRGPWQWDKLTAPLLLLSVCTAAYGWSYDQVVLLPVVMVIVRRALLHSVARRAALLGTVVASQMTLVAQNLCGVGEFFYIWHPVVWTGLYLWSARVGRVQAVSEVGGDTA